MSECLDEGILQSYFDGELSSRMAEGVATHVASCVACAQAASELESENLLLSQALGAEFALSVPTERLRQRLDEAIAELPVTRRAGGASLAGAVPVVPAARRWVQSIAELFTLSPQRAFGYAGLAAVVLFASLIGGLYWNRASGVKSSGNDNKSVAVNSGTGAPVSVPVAASSPDAPAPLNEGPKTPVKKRPVSHSGGGRNEIETSVKLLPGERSYLKTIAALDAAIKAETNPQMKASLQAEYQRNLAMVDQAIAATRSAAKVNPSDPDAAEFMFAAYQSKIDLLSQVADSRLSNRQH